MNQIQATTPSTPQETEIYELLSRLGLNPAIEAPIGDTVQLIIAAQMQLGKPCMPAKAEALVKCAEDYIRSATKKVHKASDLGKALHAYELAQAAMEDQAPVHIPGANNSIDLAVNALLAPALSGIERNVFQQRLDASQFISCAIHAAFHTVLYYDVNVGVPPAVWAKLLAQYKAYEAADVERAQRIGASTKLQQDSMQMRSFIRKLTQQAESAEFAGLSYTPTMRVLEQHEGVYKVKYAGKELSRKEISEQRYSKLSLEEKRELRLKQAKNELERMKLDNLSPDVSEHLLGLAGAAIDEAEDLLEEEGGSTERMGDDTAVGRYIDPSSLANRYIQDLRTRNPNAVIDHTWIHEMADLILNHSFSQGLFVKDEEGEERIPYAVEAAGAKRTPIRERNDIGERVMGEHRDYRLLERLNLARLHGPGEKDKCPITVELQSELGRNPTQSEVQAAWRGVMEAYDIRDPNHPWAIWLIQPERNEEGEVMLPGVSNFRGQWQNREEMLAQLTMPDDGLSGVTIGETPIELASIASLHAQGVGSEAEANRTHRQRADAMLKSA